MTKIPGKVLWLGSVCVLASHAAPAQVRRDEPKAQLRMVVILSRHGVRSPTWTQARLDSYSALPWPKWNVPPGNLTARGYTLIKQFGSFNRAALAQGGLFAATGCDAASSTYIWADTDQRTIASGKALGEGLFPSCPPSLHGLPEGQNDPLFHPAANGVKPPEADVAFAELTARVNREKLQQSLLLDQLREALLGCPLQISCTPVRQPETPLPLAQPTAAVRGKGDHTVDLTGPLPLASTFSEDFLLEYADGMPLDHVGWGHVDESQLARFLDLHTAYFDLMHRTSALARVEASNMLLHIERTLEQAVAQKSVDGAIGPPGSKLVILAGHDTNLAALASLLGVHWHLDGRADDTPPGTELAFELWQDSTGAYSVRATVAMQTLKQLRDMPELTLAAPPAQETLSLPGCSAAAQACGWAEFQRIAAAAIDPRDVVPMKAQ